MQHLNSAYVVTKSNVSETLMLLAHFYPAIFSGLPNATFFRCSHSWKCVWIRPFHSIMQQTPKFIQSFEWNASKLLSTIKRFSTWKTLFWNSLKMPELFRIPFKLERMSQSEQFPNVRQSKVYEYDFRFCIYSGILLFTISHLP